MSEALARTLLVGLGGAFGAVARYWIGVGVVVPWGTFLVNVVGCALIGLFAGSAWAGESSLRLLLAVGVLGGFTTFSSFALEAVRLMEEGRLGAALLYAGGTLVSCLFAAGGGVWLARAVGLGRG